MDDRTSSRRRAATAPAMMAAAALAAWRDIVGVDGVVTSPEGLAAANRATLAASTAITAIVVPTDRTQVGPCLAVATRFGIPVHAVSRGCNWGYGSRLPPRAEAVLLSLSRLDRVLYFDEALAMVRVEPGVTFKSLAAHLSEAGSNLLPPSTGSSEDTSILGNVMERGIGKGLYEDMAAQACGFEVVLPTGDTVYTGAVSPTNGASQTASGPDIRGLFVQSNLGVVTAMDFRLHPAPRHRQLVWTRLQTDAALASFIDTIRPVLQRGDPWFRAELITDHRARGQGGGIDDGVEGWLAIVWIWGDDEADLVQRRQRALGAMQAAGGKQSGVGAVQPGSGYAMGVEGLRGAYSAKPDGMPADPDPDRDRCGVIWVAPMVLMLGAGLARTVAALVAIMARHGFGPALSLRAMDGRVAKAVIGLFYDRDDPGGDDRAEACRQALHQVLQSQGLLPYRLGITDAPARGDPGRDRLLQAIKSKTDPAGILAPGRYVGGFSTLGGAS